MDLVHPRCAGVDVSKRDAKVCVRVAGPGRAGATSKVTTWGSFTNQVLALREHLISEQVTLVVMEATGVIRGRQRASATTGDGPGLPGSPSAADGLSGAPPPRGKPTTELIPLRPLVDAAFALPVAEAYARA
jgi:hypothetical protein